MEEAHWQGGRRSQQMECGVFQEGKRGTAGACSVRSVDSEPGAVSMGPAGGAGRGWAGIR